MWKKVWGESVPGIKCSRISCLVTPVENLILEYMFGSSIVWMLLKTIALCSVYLALAETIILTSQISMKYAFFKNYGTWCSLEL